MKSSQHFYAQLPSNYANGKIKDLALDNDLVVELAEYNGYHYAYFEGVLVHALGGTVLKDLFEDDVKKRFSGADGKNRLYFEVHKRRQQVQEAIVEMRRELGELDRIMVKHNQLGSFDCHALMLDPIIDGLNSFATVGAKLSDDIKGAVFENTRQAYRLLEEAKKFMTDGRVTRSFAVRKEDRT